MKILDMKINWNYKCSNKPRIQVLVDEIPKIDDMLFSVNGNLYYSEIDGYVRFFYYNRPGDGYSGQIYHLRLDNGKQIDLVGPWSSRASVMNDVGFAHCTEVSLTTEPETMIKGHTFFGGAMSVSVLREAMKKHLPDHELIVDLNNDETSYIVVKKGVTDPCKRCKGSGKCDGAINWSDPMKLIRCPECGGRGQAR